MTCRIKRSGKKISFLHNSEFFSFLFLNTSEFFGCYFSKFSFFYIFFFLFIGFGLEKLIFFFVKYFFIFLLLFFQILLFFHFFFSFYRIRLGKAYFFFCMTRLREAYFFPSFSNKNNKINISRTTLSKKILICNENILRYGAYVWPPVFQSICMFECKFSQNIESFSFFFSNKEYDASFLFKKFLL